MKMQNPPDRFFKEAFSNVEVASDFIKNYLPESILKIIDLETRELQNDSFSNQEIQEVFSDMLLTLDPSR